MHRTFLFSAILAFSPALTNWGAPVEITTAELRGAVQPQVAVSRSGRAAVVFGRGNAVYFIGDDGALKFSAPVKVGELDKLALKMRRGPRVAVSDRLILVTAISHTDGNIHAWLSADGGKSFESRPPLNTVARSAREGMMGLAGDGKGMVAAVWLDLRGKGAQLWGRFSSDGGSSWGEEKMIYASPDGHVCECCHPSVAIGPEGEIAVMWRNWLDGSRDLYAATSRDLGNTFTPAQKLGEGTWKLFGCPMDGGSLAAGADGKWRFVWRREARLYSHRWAAAEEQISSDGRQPVIAFAGEEPFVVWEEKKGLQLQEPGGSVKRLIEEGSAPSLASGEQRVTIAWEAGAGAAKGLWIMRYPK